MPKIRTNRGAAKRFRVTGSGKIRRYHSHANHILTKKSSKRKRGLRKGALIAQAEERRVRRLIVT